MLGRAALMSATKTVFEDHVPMSNAERAREVCLGSGRSAQQAPRLLDIAHVQGELGHAMEEPAELRPCKQPGSDANSDQFAQGRVVHRVEAIDVGFSGPHRGEIGEYTPGRGCFSKTKHERHRRVALQVAPFGKGDVAERNIHGVRDNLSMAGG